MIRVGTRPSPLALAQVEEVKQELKSLFGHNSFEIVQIATTGDIDKKTFISEIEESDFFTKEIDRALLSGRIDLAVHSAKDLPEKIHLSLKIILLTESIDPFEALVSKESLRLRDLPPGAKVGTSSLHRKIALKRFRDDFNIVDIRGNIEERLNLLEESELDGIVIAAAGLVRLGLENYIAERIPFEILEPHPLQGRLAVMSRKGFNEKR